MARPFLFMRTPIRLFNTECGGNVNGGTIIQIMEAKMTSTPQIELPIYASQDLLEARISADGSEEEILE